ncbi:putative flap endonuclease-1-like 5' DNA nuclease [Sphingomonas jejuensis]|uniref:Flap endonuclease-1-like 5' DNA nuclease n=1 Tax=Sphingomonas jejuensis TaxID=904715 RepID=A0ABX0XHZ8_9SPHN|nr:hypothetical protein [Sphingomonas jejuensis]NJC32850.1 putative flap endonuclease-1-like 5' DNA nuclease [Sphingomonas jejuensis]
MAFSFTLTEWVIVGLVLVFGWVLGLLSSSGGKKWRARYDEEHAARAADRTAHAEALKAEQTRYEALEKNHRELERNHRELERSRAAAPVAAATTAAAAASAGTASTTRSGDDLGRIRGIGPDGRARLAEEGLHSYHDVETLDDSRAEEIERRHGLAPGTIRNEDWRGQARALREGR